MEAGSWDGKADSHDSIFGFDFRFSDNSDSKKLLTQINISTGMTLKDFAKFAK